MKRLLVLFAAIALVIGFFPIPAAAGGFGVFSRPFCSNKVVAVQQHVQHVQQVQTVVAVQSVPVQVTFVPSQVLLNGQVTQYNSTPFSYSYQGSAIDPKAYAQYQQQQAAAQYQQQVGPQQQAENSLESRMSRIEALVEEIAKRQGINVTPAVQQPSMTLGDVDQTHIANTWTSCKNCHSPGGKGAAKLVMFDAGGELLPELPRYKIYQAVQNQSMPPDPTQKITGEQLEALRKWVHQGLVDLNY